MSCDGDVAARTLDSKLRVLIDGLREDRRLGDAEAAEVIVEARALLEMLTHTVMLVSKELDGTPAIRLYDGKFYRTCAEDLADIVRAAYEVSRG